MIQTTLILNCKKYYISKQLKEFRPYYCVMAKVYNEDLYYTKSGVELHEYKMHKYVYNLHVVNVPKIVKYDKRTKVMVMHKVNGLNISDMYSETLDNISNELFEQVREIIKTLVYHNVEYIDITGYNFILDNNDKLWIIDFEHAKYTIPMNDEFVKKFCNGLNEWNPEFR